MSTVNVILKRELSSYFATPLAYIFIVIFLMLVGVFTFYFGQFYERGQADLVPFFMYHPWLYLFLIPAIAMRMWAEERKTGTIELLLTLPINLKDAILGKFLAAWIFIGIGLVLTFPVWITVNYLGDPDNGVILAGYLGSWFMAGAFLAISACMSATTSNHVIAFILSIVICFLLVVAGDSVVLSSFYNWAPTFLVDVIASLSFLTHFSAISKGVLDIRDMLFFIVMMAAWLIAAAVIIDMKKA